MTENGFYVIDALEERKAAVAYIKSDGFSP
jgi:hypothetical protein